VSRGGVICAACTVASLCLALASCEPRYDHLGLDLESSPPVAISVASNHIEITSGVAVVVRVEPISGNAADYDDSADVELATEDPGVLDVVPGQTPREFALVGVWPGETRLIVTVDGSVVDHIDFACTPFEEHAP
jgi:hypothetical protein